MKKAVFTLAMLMFAISPVLSQTPVKIYTNPKVPGRDALERMNLALAWNTRVTVDGNRDGIASLQLIPGSPNQLVAQTYKGGVFLYDADNGDLIWKTSVGTPYWISQPVGFNSQNIFVTRRDALHVLNRVTGVQRVYSFEPGSKLPTFGINLSFTPSAAPVADEEFLYVSMGSRVHALVIPDFEGFDRIKRARELAKRDDPKGEKKDPTKEDKLPFLDELPATDSPDSLQPFFYWGFALPGQTLEYPPLFSGEQISMITVGGLLTSVNRYERGPRVENFEFKVIGKTLGGAGQHGRVAYFGSTDFNLYAVDMSGGKLLWRHLSGSPILSKPEVTDREIFVTLEGVGLRSVDRFSGREIWTNRTAQRFLATNNQYVYALDKVGQFYVLDARRGGTLAKYDLADWTISVANEWTDRIYLAANDGQIMCLRHRDLKKPLALKTTEAPPKAKEVKKKEEKKEEKKDDEKKDDEKKDAARANHIPVNATAMLDAVPMQPSRNRLNDALAMRDERRLWVER